MSILFKEIKFQEDETCGGGTSVIRREIIIHNEDTFAWFKQMIQRAFNVWDFAPAEAKEFADVVLHGKVLQDYKAQEDKPKLYSGLVLPKLSDAEALKLWQNLPLCPECGNHGVGHRSDCPAKLRK